MRVERKQHTMTEFRSVHEDHYIVKGENVEITLSPRYLKIKDSSANGGNTLVVPPTRAAQYVEALRLLLEQAEEDHA